MVDIATQLTEICMVFYIVSGYSAVMNKQQRCHNFCDNQIIKLLDYE